MSRDNAGAVLELTRTLTLPSERLNQVKSACSKYLNLGRSCFTQVPRFGREMYVRNTSNKRTIGVGQDLPVGLQRDPLSRDTP